MRPFTYTNEFYNPWLLTLDVTLILHFCYTYYKYCLRLGFKFDFWHFTVLIGGVLPVLVNYIFAGALENRWYVWSALPGIQGSLDQAFTIQIVGYLCMYLGFYYYNLRHSAADSIRPSLINAVVSKTTYLFRDFVNTGELLYTFLVLTVAAGTVLMIVVFVDGLGLNLRSLVFGDSALRPIYNVCFVAAGPIILGAVWARYLATKRRSTLVAALLMLTFQILSGTRGPVIIPIGTLIAVYVVVKGRSVSVTSVAIALAALLLLAVGISLLRVAGSGNGSVAVNPLSELAYGNDYSDTRDFAWILSKWDGEFLNGKSYVAGLVSFLPRAFFMKDLRESWGFTYFADSLLRLDPAYHPGVRPGRYGELYMNFGYPAVIIAGFFTGYLCRLIDHWIKLRNTAGVHDIVTDFSIAMCFSFFEPLYHSVSMWQAYMLLAFFAAVIVHRSIRAANFIQPVVEY